MAGVPDTGARTLLRTDPLTRGQEVFQLNCASCHAFTPGEDEEKKYHLEAFPRNKDRKASDLGDWGTAKWVRGLLANPADPHYFGGIEQLTGMKNWRKRVDRKRKTMDAKEVAAQDADFQLIARLLAPSEPHEADLKVKGLEAFERQKCAQCHTLGSNEGDNTAPNLTGWGSAEWIRGMILARRTTRATANTTKTLRRARA